MLPPNPVLGGDEPEGAPGAIISFVFPANCILGPSWDGLLQLGLLGA
jgi:hypothetical protein